MIDHVLYPIPEKNIVELGAETPDFSQLVFAVVKANLEKTLEGIHSFIFFTKKIL